jgi:putative membrane protein
VPSDDGDREPDYRFTLANERTFLAWMRTSLALLAGGLAARELAGSFDVSGAGTGLALAAVALSLVLAVTSYVRWAQIQRAMRRGEALPHPLIVPLLATGIAAVATAAGLLIVLA